MLSRFVPEFGWREGRSLPPAEPVSKGNRMIWGYAGVFPGEFNLWQGDATMNKLQFMVDHRFRSTGMHQKELTDPARRDQVVRFVQDHDLRITLHLSAGVPGHFFGPDTDAIRRGLDECVAGIAELGPQLNTPIVTFGVGPYHRFMAEPSLEWQMDRLAEVLPAPAAALAELGMPLGIENHGDYYVSDIVELCGRVEHLGIFLDTGNCCLVGEKPVPAAREAAPLTIGTHFKDHILAPKLKDGLALDIGGAALGAGHVGLVEIYAVLLAKAPQPEKLVMQWELIPPKGEDPWQVLEQSWRFIESLDPQARKKELSA
jgi:sugar phosphate isomerase/epimerase